MYVQVYKYVEVYEHKHWWYIYMYIYISQNMIVTCDSKNKFN